MKMISSISHGMSGILWTIAFILIVSGLSAQVNPLSVDTAGIQIRVAAGQFQLEPDLQANLQKINFFLDQAYANDVELIVFPELALTGYPPPGYTSIDFIVQENTEKALKQLQIRAGDLSMAIAIGTGWKDEDGVWRNRAFFLFGPMPGTLSSEDKCMPSSINL